MEIILITKYVQAIVNIEKITPQDTWVFITFHITCYKICKQNASTKRWFLFCLFYFYFFVVYKIILTLPFVSFFMITCFEFQVRIMLHFAYSIFYIKSQTISVVKCNDIALHSCAVLLSFFLIDGMEASYWS